MEIGCPYANEASVPLNIFDRAADVFLYLFFLRHSLRFPTDFEDLFFFDWADEAMTVMGRYRPSFYPPPPTHPSPFSFCL